MTDRMILVASSKRDEKVPTSCWPTRVTGLVVTSVPATESNSGYRVTMESSGIAVTEAPFPTIPIASLFASRIEKLMDWSLSRDEISSMEQNKREKLRVKLNQLSVELLEELENNPGLAIAESIEND
jgi:hypothetical protein